MASKINLDKAKDYYIKNEITFKGLADVFKLNVETVRKRAYKEKWQELKDSYKADLITELIKPEQEPDTVDVKDLEQLRLQAIYKLLTILNKSIQHILPTETNKLKLVTSSLSDLNKIINDVKPEQAFDYSKLDLLLNTVLNAGITEPDNYKVNI